VISGSEYIRWVQDCLNRTLGLQLPLTGVLGRETRSAIRSFQKQQGLLVNGIVGPETEAAMKAACNGQRAETEDVELPVAGFVDPQFQATLKARDNGFSQHEENLELETPVLRPQFSAWLHWEPRAGGPKLYTRKEALRELRKKGVYIAVRIEEEGSQLKMKEILKVGQSPTQDFSSRITKDEHATLNRIYGDKLRYFFATIEASGGDIASGGVTPHVEHLIARTIFRAGCHINPDHHSTPYKLAKAEGDIAVNDILPTQLISLLPRAYEAKGGIPDPQEPNTMRDSRRQPIEKVPQPLEYATRRPPPEDPLWRLLWLPKGTCW
jgi:hypothetical protein